MKHVPNNIQSQAALLRKVSRADAPVKNSLCCAAADIIALPSSTAETLIPHEMLRGAAHPEATLIALDRPLAQPAEGDNEVSESSICTFKEPVFLTKIFKKPISPAKYVSNWKSLLTIGNHDHRRWGAQSIPRSHNPAGCRKGSEPSGSRFNCFFAMPFNSIVLERVRNFSAHGEARALVPQEQLKVRLSWLATFLSLTPDFTLGYGSSVPNPFADVKRREGSIDCEVAGCREFIDRFRDMTALQLVDLPVQLRQHVADISHMKRMHKTIPLIPHFGHFAPTQRHQARTTTWQSSRPSMLHDNGYQGRQI
ncbi:hypothetical protein V3H56_05495 [Pseudomonas sp. MS646]|uniref:hypothetical protein n=1 Tax=Pseudomonas sp. MS646 TaxID=3118751 RepID=UPI0030D4DD32